MPSSIRGTSAGVQAVYLRDLALLYLEMFGDSIEDIAFQLPALVEEKSGLPAIVG